MARSERHDESCGRRPSEPFQQRPAILVGADCLARVDVQISQLPNLPRSHVSRLRDKPESKLLLQREVPRLEIAALEVLGIAAEGISSRKVDDPVADWRRLDCGDAVR